MSGLPKRPPNPGRGTGSPTLAIVPWGLLVEDFLGPNGLSLEDFCTDFTGSWMFGYSLALRAAGVRTVIVCFSGEVGTVTRRVHGTTGIALRIIPATRIYRRLRARMGSPYGRTVAATFEVMSPARALLKPLLFVAKEFAPYAATPLRALASELRRDHCGAVLCQEYEFPRFDACTVVGRMLGIPVYGSFQGGDYQRWRLERLTRPLAMRCATGVIIASEAEVERVRSRYHPASVAQIPNPIDLSVWRPHDRTVARAVLGIDEGARVVAWHGRVELEKKGLDLLIEVWVRLLEVGGQLPLVLLMIGTGPDAAEVHRRLDDRGVRNVVWMDRYFHDRAEIARLLAAGDVYAFTSRHEGFPVAPVEAMACGLPVVSSDVSGIRDVLASGETSGGLIVGSRRPEQFAGELLRLLSDSGLRRSLSIRARARAQAFGNETIGPLLREYLFGDGSAEMRAPIGAGGTA